MIINGIPLVKLLMKILFLPGAYPHRENNTDGIFIKRHALAVSKFAQISVIYIDLKDNINKLDVYANEGILEIIAHRKVNKGKIPYKSLFFYLLDSYKAYRILTKKVGKPDLIHVNDLMTWPGMGIFVLYLNKIKGIPYIVTEHSSGYLEESNIFNKRSFLVKKLILYTLNKAKHITIVSNKLKSSLIKCGAKNDFSVIYNVVPSGKSKIINENRKIKKILHVSLLTQSKNIFGIIDAINEIYNKRKDFELHIIGDGLSRAKLEKMTNDYGLLNKVIFFHGLLLPEEVMNMMIDSDFHIINSQYETFSLVTAEALMCGIPVISTRCGGPEEFIDESNGLLINIDDNNALVSAIEYMLDNHDKYKANFIMEKAKCKFSPEIIGKELFETYKKVLY